MDSIIGTDRALFEAANSCYGEMTSSQHFPVP